MYLIIVMTTSFVKTEKIFTPQSALKFSLSLSVCAIIIILLKILSFVIIVLSAAASSVGSIFSLLDNL